MRKVKLFVIAALTVMVIGLLATVPAHAACTDTGPHNLTQSKVADDVTVFILNNGYPNSGCTSIWIDFASATLWDGQEACASTFYVLDNNPTAKFTELLATTTTVASEQLNHFILPIPPGHIQLSVNSSSGVTVKLSGSCTHSEGVVNATYHFS